MNGVGLDKEGAISGTVIGYTIEQNVKFYEELSDQFVECIDVDFGLAYTELMEPFRIIYNTLRKSGNKHLNDKRKKKDRIYGDAYSASEAEQLFEATDEFTKHFYAFMIEYGPPCARAEKGECNPGVKVHFLGHLRDYFKLMNGMRFSYQNEELIESVVQHLANVLKKYAHYRGAPHLRFGIRAANIKSIGGVMAEPHIVYS